MQRKARPKVPDLVRCWLAQQVEANGLQETCRRLHLADATIARVLAGLHVQYGTIVVLDRAMIRDGMGDAA